MPNTNLLFSTVLCKTNEWVSCSSHGTCPQLPCTAQLLLAIIRLQLQRQLPETPPLHIDFPVLVQSPIALGGTHTR